SNLWLGHYHEQCESNPDCCYTWYIHIPRVLQVHAGHPPQNQGNCRDDHSLPNRGNRLTSSMFAHLSKASEVPSALWTWCEIYSFPEVPPFHPPLSMALLPQAQQRFDSLPIPLSSRSLFSSR